MLNKSKDIRQKLKKLADLIADEAESNAEFGNALLKLFDTEAHQEVKKSGEKLQVFDPFEEYQARGQENFASWLEQLNIQELRAIVRQQRFDPTRLSDKWKTKDRFVKLIIERVDSRSKQGDSFRFCGKSVSESSPSNLPESLDK